MIRVPKQCHCGDMKVKRHLCAVLKQRYVVGFMFNQNETAVLLINKLKPEWQKGLYNGVGGKIERGEHPDVAMIREFEEEAGIAHAPWISFAQISDPQESWIVHFYRANTQQVFHAKSMTEEQVCLFRLDNMPENILSNLTWLIPMALDRNIRTDVITNRRG